MRSMQSKVHAEDCGCTTCAISEKGQKQMANVFANGTSTLTPFCAHAACHARIKWRTDQQKWRKSCQSYDRCKNKECKGINKRYCICSKLQCSEPNCQICNSSSSIEYK